MCRYVLCGVSVYFLDKHGQKGILHVCDTVCEGGGVERQVLEWHVCISVWRLIYNSTKHTIYLKFTHAYKCMWLCTTHSVGPQVTMIGVKTVLAGRLIL